MTFIKNRLPKIWFALPFVAALALIGLLYWGTFSWWWVEWTMPGSFYAHSVFVPFFVAVMVYRNRERLAAARWQPSWFGLPLVALAMVVLLVAQRSGVTVIQSLSFVLLLFGSALLLLGVARSRILLFPLLFVMMMMPLVPDQLINGIAFPIQITSAKIATSLLNLITLHSVREGTMIQMENYKMAVELPCSGFKTLVSLLTFSAAFAYLVEGALWKRWLLFLMTAPLSLFINAMRITFIGIVGELVSARAAATFHDWSGFISLIIAFLFLFNFARLIRCERFLGIPLNEEEEKRDQEAAKAPPAEAAPAAPAWWQPILAWRPDGGKMRRVTPYILAINAVLLATLAVQSIALKPVKPLPPIATVQVPREFAVDGVTWKVNARDPLLDRLPKSIQEVLNPTRVINRDYNGSDGGMIQVFITAGNGRKVFHDPHTCSLGSDAILQDIGVIPIATSKGVVSVQESHYKRTGSNDEYEVMFCYVVEGKVVQSTTGVRNSMIMQTLLGDSGKPSYFFRITQRVAGTSEARRQQMTQFIQGMWEQVGPVLKGEAPAIDEAAPVPVTEGGV